MFEDLDKWLKENKEKLPDDENDKDASNNERMLNKLPKEVQDAMKDLVFRHGGKLGKIVAVEVTEGKEEGSEQKLRKLFASSLDYIGTKAKVKRECLDADGNILKVGDQLQMVGISDVKTVLHIGFKFANLSRTEDQTRDDGVWFEEEIRLKKWVKSKKK